jgi:hypothetical protein
MIKISAVFSALFIYGCHDNCEGRGEADYSNDGGGGGGGKWRGIINASKIQRQALFYLINILLCYTAGAKGSSIIGDVDSSVSEKSRSRFVCIDRSLNTSYMKVPWGKCLPERLMCTGEYMDIHTNVNKDPLIYGKSYEFIRFPSSLPQMRLPFP